MHQETSSRSEITLDTLHGTLLLAGNKADNDSRSAGACGAARTMDIILRIRRGIEVNHRVDGVDVNASGCDVGRDQRLGTTRGEVL